jgi:hypothetical protein
MATAPGSASALPRSGMMRAFVMESLDHVGFIDKPIPELLIPARIAKHGSQLRGRSPG